MGQKGNNEDPEQGTYLAVAWVSEPPPGEPISLDEFEIDDETARQMRANLLAMSGGVEERYVEENPGAPWWVDATEMTTAIVLGARHWSSLNVSRSAARPARAARIMARKRSSGRWSATCVLSSVVQEASEPVMELARAGAQGTRRLLRRAGRGLGFVEGADLEMNECNLGWSRKSR